MQAALPQDGPSAKLHTTSSSSANLPMASTTMAYIGRSSQHPVVASTKNVGRNRASVQFTMATFGQQKPAILALSLFSQLFDHLFIELTQPALDRIDVDVVPG